jgi:hypothetical protein
MTEKRPAPPFPAPCRARGPWPREASERADLSPTLLADLPDVAAPQRLPDAGIPVLRLLATPATRAGSSASRQRGRWPRCICPLDSLRCRPAWSPSRPAGHPGRPTGHVWRPGRGMRRVPAKQFGPLWRARVGAVNGRGAGIAWVGRPHCNGCRAASCLVWPSRGLVGHAGRAHSGTRVTHRSWEQLGDRHVLSPLVKHIDVQGGKGNGRQRAAAN